MQIFPLCRELAPLTPELFKGTIVDTTFSSSNHLSLRLIPYLQFSSLQSLSRDQLFATPWTVARQDSLSIINYGSLLKLMPIESVMSSNHLILCRPFLLLPLIFPSIRVFSNELVLRIRWPRYWSSIS